MLMQAGMVVHACNPCTWKLKWEGLEFKANLNHMEGLCHNLQSHSNMAFTSKQTHRQTIKQRTQEETYMPTHICWRTKQPL